MYKLLQDKISGVVYGAVKQNDDGSGTSIPFVADNTDYANFKKDLADGAELQDAEGNVIDGIAYLEELV
jgi:hypothetical protein